MTSSSSTSHTPKSGFVCPLKFYNDLPDLPFDAKLLEYSLTQDRFIKYRATSLEKNFKNVLHTNIELDFPIDLVDPTIYEIKDKEKIVALPEADKKLFEERESFALKKPDAYNKPNVRWLRKTEYMSSALDIKPLKKSEDHSSDTVQILHRNQQIEIIEKSFDDAKKTPKHKLKPNLTVQSILPIFPNEDMWGEQYFHVLFDRDPNAGLEGENLESKALIKSYGWKPKQPLIAYLVPKKRKREEEANEENQEKTEEPPIDENELDWARDMTIDYSKSKVDQGNSTYLLTQTNDKVLYSPLSKRAMTHIFAKDLSEYRPSKITVEAVPKTESEEEARLKLLEQIQH